MLYKNNLFRFVKLFNYLVFSVFYKKPYNIIFISIFASKKELINTISSLFLDHCLYFIFIIIYKFHRSWYSCFIINSCSIIFCQIFNWCNSPCMKNCFCIPFVIVVADFLCILDKYAIRLELSFSFSIKYKIAS